MNGKDKPLVRIKSLNKDPSEILEAEVAHPMDAGQKPDRAFSFYSKTCVSGSKFGYDIMMWRIADGTLLCGNQTESEIECVSYSPDGKYIACGVEDFNVYIL